ncbi:hypothetical protein [Nannocystis pusilla]|uniref:hypothetical protein n=1 Tax=Nannocystis pusilla TaxID=889268 RepID=UPI003BF0A08E
MLTINAPRDGRITVLRPIFAAPMIHENRSTRPPLVRPRGSALAWALAMEEADASSWTIAEGCTPRAHAHCRRDFGFAWPLRRRSVSCSSLCDVDELTPRKERFDAH